VPVLAEGIPARAIAARLGLTEPAVRNHIRATLLELGAHSQLESVFRARCHGLL
jgi:DNA-binding NarL/FixJ family response regulator